MSVTDIYFCVFIHLFSQPDSGNLGREYPIGTNRRSGRTSHMLRKWFCATRLSCRHFFFLSRLPFFASPASARQRPSCNSPSLFLSASHAFALAITSSVAAGGAARKSRVRTIFLKTQPEILNFEKKRMGLCFNNPFSSVPEQERERARARERELY